METRPGQSIGPYVVRRELGRGGMGVVYLATDQRLGREVAIKALPEHLAADPDRLARFQREARVLASLNHPNIAGIHGLEEAGGHHYLVLEYVEGEPLNAVLERGPMPIDEAVNTAVAIAQALEAAHEKGIVHRDLKPANIMLTADGVPKVLDFGLARQSESSGSTTDVSPDSPTLTTPPVQPVNSPTIPGAIMGTAGYMSPEQARGRPVDKRSDVFSFGCVLYELLTGARPFAGETIADVLGATLHKDLDLSLLPADTPPNVRRVLARCLAKDKRQRTHDIADARIELQTPEPAGTTDRPDPARRRLVPLVAMVFGGALLAAAGAGGVWLTRPAAPALIPAAPAPPPVVLDAEILLPAGQRLGHAFHPGVAISDDGTTIVFPINDEPAPETDLAADRGGWVTSTGLVLRRLDAPGLTPVVGAGPGSLQPVFSPDGRWIAYVANNAEIMKIPASGGQPVRLVTAAAPVVGLDWHTDGSIYFGHRLNAGIHRVSENGGRAEAVTTPDRDAGETAHALPAVVPGGGVLFTVYAEDFDAASVAYAPPPGTEADPGPTHAVIAEDASHPRFSGDHVVFAREGALFAVPFNPAAAGGLPNPTPLPERAVHAKYFGNTLTMTHAAQFDLSPAGALVIAEGGVPTEPAFVPVWVNADGVETPLDIEPRSYIFARAPRDSGRLIFTSAHGPTRAVWAHEPHRGVTRRISRPAEIWSASGPGPDDVTLLLQRDAEARPALGTLNIDAGPSSFRPLAVPDDLTVSPAEWSPDGRFLLAVGRRSTADDDAGGAATVIWVYERDVGWSRLTESDTPLEGWPTLSPDGRWIAYATLESDRFEVYASPFNRPGPARRVSHAGGIEPRWSPDGSQIYYREASDTGLRPGRAVLSVAVSFDESDPDRITLSRPVERFQTASDYVAVVPIASWDFAPDGRALFIRQEDPATRHAFMSELFPDRVRVVHNWTLRLTP